MGKGYEKRHKVTRVLLADYQLLKSLSQTAGVSMAEAFHRLITETERERIVVPKSQIPMPAFQVVSQPTFRVSTAPTIAVNGNKAGVFVVKPKGGVIRG
ncbi:unnamed protein product [marine sediment metagenome]|uniref:Uncharacterized protein n=1 Tax=marine sediment metagenome TaxID=412755 RepID=X1TRC1_9ZZZZ